MAERVDLENAERMGHRWGTDSRVGATILALVAELRATREVATAAAKFWETFGDDCDSPICDDLAHALNAYDQATGRPAAADQPPGEAP